MSVLDHTGRARITICAGAGGVGKTTTAAAIAALRAGQGDRVALVTIDPARRLADALGIAALGGDPQPVPLPDAGPGKLWAMMLDPQETLDALIADLAEDDAARETILQNPIYRRLSGAVAGSQEFTAIAKLYELDRSGRFDAIVLDTPPSRNALDFLEAPERLTAFLEGRGLTTLIAPAGPVGRLAGRGSGLVLGALGRLTGSDLLRDIQEFLSAFGIVLDGFRERARAVRALLADQDTAFVVVTSAEREPAAEAIHFAGELREAQLPPRALIVTRVTPCRSDRPPVDEPAIAALLGGDPALAAKVARAVRSAHAIGASEAAQIAQLRAELGLEPILVPRLGGDLHDVRGLTRLAEWLALSDRARAAALRERAI